MQSNEKTYDMNSEIVLEAPLTRSSVNLQLINSPLIDKSFSLLKNQGILKIYGIDPNNISYNFSGDGNSIDSINITVSISLPSESLNFKLCNVGTGEIKGNLVSYNDVAGINQVTISPESFVIKPDQEIDINTYFPMYVYDSKLDGKTVTFRIDLENAHHQKESAMYSIKKMNLSYTFAPAFEYMMRVRLGYVWKCYGKRVTRSSGESGGEKIFFSEKYSFIVIAIPDHDPFSFNISASSLNPFFAFGEMLLGRNPPDKLGHTYDLWTLTGLVVINPNERTPQKCLFVKNVDRLSNSENNELKRVKDYRHIIQVEYDSVFNVVFIVPQLEQNLESQFLNVPITISLQHKDNIYSINNFSFPDREDSDVYYTKWSGVSVFRKYINVNKSISSFFEDRLQIKNDGILPHINQAIIRYESRENNEVCAKLYKYIDYNGGSHMLTRSIEIVDDNPIVIFKKGILFNKMQSFITSFTFFSERSRHQPAVVTVNPNFTDNLS